MSAGSSPDLVAIKYENTLFNNCFNYPSKQFMLKQKKDEFSVLFKKAKLKTNFIETVG